MRYTVAGGVENNLVDRFSDNSRYLFPLFAVLLAVIYLGLHHGSNLHKTQKPLTLGIYTVKTGSGSGGSGSGSGGSGSGSGGQNNSSAPGLSSAAPNQLSSTATPGIMPLASSNSLTSSTNPQSGGLTATVQTPGLSVGPVSLSGTTQVIDPPLSKPSFP